jgi:hypothetical protein
VEIGVIEIHLIGGIDHAEFLLETRAAAERDASAAHHRVPADVVVLFDDEDGCALIARHDGGTQPRCTSSGDDDIGGSIPLRDALRRRFVLAGDADDSRCADAERTPGDELSSACPELGRGAEFFRGTHLTVTSTS